MATGAHALTNPRSYIHPTERELVVAQRGHAVTTGSNLSTVAIGRPVFVRYRCARPTCRSPTELSYEMLAVPVVPCSDR
ncbi:MAG: hypothetical protein KDA52_21840, partial [Planctomycetaceae bacterium]|nr:hypothetical protein [Planctomycetaceae bacterium]